jgi:hypothetical protein
MNTTTSRAAAPRNFLQHFSNQMIDKYQSLHKNIAIFSRQKSKVF